MFGLTTDEHAFIGSRVVKPLAKNGARVYCFGSRARGTHKQFSDLDLMVEADHDCSALIGELQEQLTESNFPYKVDLVEFQHYAQAYVPGYLLERVLFPLQVTSSDLS
jgi:predicted nucleotidyltransferase